MLESSRDECGPLTVSFFESRLAVPAFHKALPKHSESAPPDAETDYLGADRPMSTLYGWDIWRLSQSREECFACGTVWFKVSPSNRSRATRCEVLKPAPLLEHWRSRTVRDAFNSAAPLIWLYAVRWSKIGRSISIRTAACWSGDSVMFLGLLGCSSRRGPGLWRAPSIATAAPSLGLYSQAS